jgi:UDP-N-acetylmuramoylalanine--D-glutamate ligase
MNLTKTSATKRMIVGLGMSGLSCARFCQRRGWAFDLCDSRDEPTNLDSIRQEFPESTISCGVLDGELLSLYDELIVSPGVALAEPAIQQAIRAGVKISGDIQLFKEFVTKPVIAITGSNGKSTVTSLTGDMLNSCGVKALVGGNIGLPALDLISDVAADGSDKDSDVDVYVLELSSFQLETTTQLNAAVATILNLSEDHMDRYSGMEDYLAAKQRIFAGASAIVENKDDDTTKAYSDSSVVRFGLNSPETGEFGLRLVDGQDWIYFGSQPLLSADQIKIKGQHNLANVMSALALVQAVVSTLNIQLTDSFSAIKTFAGLAHRCQWVADINGVACYNDSKGTNVGSTLAAISGLGASSKGKIWLLAGGVDKDQNFSDLILPCKKYVAEVLLFGRDAINIQKDLGDCKTEIFATMDQAWSYALQEAEPGDLVLLSPACASFDQFKNFAVRGEYFRQLVMSSQEVADD